jgi:hypothetical protein
MNSPLKDVYNQFFPSKSALGFERLTYTLIEKLNIVCIISKFTSIEDLKPILRNNNFNFIESEKKDNFYTFITSYTKYDEKLERELKINVKYKLYIDKERDLLLFFTTSNKIDIEKTLFKLIESQYGFYYAFLSPVVFESIKDKIFSEVPNTIIPYFTVVRKPYYRFKCKIRPEERRSITYQSGSDGRETLEEFKSFYGMLPHLIEFEIPEIARFRIDYRGIFSFYSGKIEYIDDLINFIVSTIIRSKNIIEKSKIDVIEVKTENKKILVPKASSWSIKFSNPIKFEEVENLIVLLSKGNFTVADSYTEKGSLLWSATVLDYQKNSIFSIKSNGEKLTVLPRYEPKFDSLLRFFHFFLENFDSNAIIEGAD